MKNNNDNEIKRNIITLGKTDVGKTCILNRYFNKTFSSSTLMTIGMDCYTKKYIIKSKNFKVNFYDTAGQEKYHSLTKIFVHDSKIAFIVYAINDLISYQKVDFWYNFIKENCGDIIIGIIGNKKDLYEEEEVNEKEAIKKAEELGVIFGLTSALEDDTGFDEIMQSLVKQYITKKGGSVENEIFSKNIKLNANKSFKDHEIKRKKKCC